MNYLFFIAILETELLQMIQRSGDSKTVQYDLPKEQVTASQQVRLVREFTFEAAHRLNNVPQGHKCGRLHGHSFRIEVICEGNIDPYTGWLIDFADIKKLFDPLLKQLDHYYLNDIEGLENPTAENLARWIWIRLKPDLAPLTQINVAETCSARCEYRG